MFSLICAWISGWVNNREAGDLKRYRAHYDVIVMVIKDSDGYGTTGILIIILFKLVNDMQDPDFFTFHKYDDKC